MICRSVWKLYQNQNNLETHQWRDYIEKTGLLMVMDAIEADLHKAPSMSLDWE
jgi:hypothetical protein